MSGIAPKQNVFKFKIAPHQQKFIVNFVYWQEDGPHLDNEALCLTTPKLNGKSRTGLDLCGKGDITFILGMMLTSRRPAEVVE